MIAVMGARGFRPRRVQHKALAFFLLLLVSACAQAHPPQPAPQAALPPPAPVTRSRFFTASDGTRLHMLQSGSGQTIVFVPGWDMPGWIFEPQLRDFSRTYNVVAFDPRGQGDSDIPAAGYELHRRGHDIADLIATLNNGPVVLVGWSLGVLDVLAYLADYGDAQVAALVLIDNSVGELPAPPPPPRLPPRRSRVRVRPISRQAAMHAFVAGMFRTPQSAEYIDRLTQAALRVPPAASAALLRYDVPRSFWRAAVYGTGKPLLYVVRSGLSGQAQNLQAGRADTQSVVLPNVGHALFVDDPNVFDALMRSFLRRTVAP